jgi:type II secretory pathway component PulJ
MKTLLSLQLQTLLLLVAIHHLDTITIHTRHSRKKKNGNRTL